MGLKQVAELQQRRGVPDPLTTQIDTEKPAQRLGVVDRVFQPFVREPEPLLQEVHPQHPLQPDRWTPASALGIQEVVRRQRRQQHRPGNQPLHGEEGLIGGRVC